VGIIAPPEAPAFTGADWRGWDWAGGEDARADRTASARTRRGIDKRFFLVHSAAQRGGPAATDRFIKQQHEDDPPSVRWSLPKDPGGTAIHFNSYVTRELCPGRTTKSSREEGDKGFRAGPVASQFEQDNFFIVRHPGCEITRAELIEFPYGEHDDLVDAISRSFMEHVVGAPPETPTAFGGYIVSGDN
jgi:predicted phage terminase large subunit-like protein